MSVVWTIGVYGFDGASFIDCLRRHDIAMVVDVRQRRGVRGPDYSWANSKRLQAGLAEARLGYRHHRDLAPTTALRHLQYAEDERTGVGKRNRVHLAPAYVDQYTHEILDPADLSEIAQDALTRGPIALFCVERDPEACHRSLIAQRLAEELGVTIDHLGPRRDVSKA